MKLFQIAIMLILMNTMANLALAQQPIPLSKIWNSRELQPRSAGSFRFLEDGRHFTRLQQNRIVRYDIVSGKEVEVIYAGNDSLQIQEYTFSKSEQYILIATGSESIYRYSSRAQYFTLDRKTSSIRPVAGGKKVMYATFSPEGSHIAYVHDNNLWYEPVGKGNAVQITKDGKVNAIINGASDWVYEEEFTLVRAFEWSPDGTRIAFFRFDESAVPSFTMQMFEDELYPRDETFKYPKVGETNATVNIMIHDLPSGETRKLDTESEKDQYLPRIKWTNDPDYLAVIRLNRHQNDLTFWLFSAVDGSRRVILHEQNAAYIDVHDNLHFLKDGKHFTWTSEKDGWNHIYLHHLENSSTRQLTTGQWEVTEFYGVDEKNELVYFQANRKSPMQREIYSCSMRDGSITAIKDSDGYNSGQFSSTYDYLVHSHSTINSPAIHIVLTRKGDAIRPIEQNNDLVEKQRLYGVQPVHFFTCPGHEGLTLNGWMIRPAQFDPKKQYPVLMFVYGGPGSQQVLDNWRGANYWWFQMLAQQGYIVACVDNRGTGGRGETFKKSTYLQLGHYETLDQIAAARYLGALPYVDASRIGIFGWSYGGYMSSLCILKGSDVFKAAIAVAPVTNWKWYDTIYTERFMRTAAENPLGYKDNSPVYFADGLKGHYLLIHGMGDDNVHFQNAVEMSRNLIAAGKHFDMVYYPNKNHSIAGGNSRLHLYERMTLFLKEKL